MQRTLTAGDPAYVNGAFIKSKEIFCKLWEVKVSD